RRLAGNHKNQQQGGERHMGALSYRAARLAASIPNLAVEAKRPLLHYRSTAIPLSMIKCCELLCLDDAQHCLAIGRGRKGRLWTNRAKPEKLHVLNSLGGFHPSGTAFDSTRSGCARVVNFSAW